MSVSRGGRDEIRGVSFSARFFRTGCSSCSTRAQILVVHKLSCSVAPISCQRSVSLRRGDGLTLSRRPDSIALTWSRAKRFYQEELPHRRLPVNCCPAVPTPHHHIDTLGSGAHSMNRSDARHHIVSSCVCDIVSAKLDALVICLSHGFKTMYLCSPAVLTSLPDALDASGMMDSCF